MKTVALFGLAAATTSFALGPIPPACTEPIFTVQDYVAEGGPAEIALGDIDGDGDLDMALANGFSDDVAVLLNNGDGTFAAEQRFGAGDTARAVGIGDMDGDGLADLIVANGVSDDVSILLGRGDGTFETEQRIAIGESPLTLRMGDLDGDGDVEAVITNRSSDNVSIIDWVSIPFIGDLFLESHRVDVGREPRGLSLGDLDGDGDLDVAVVNGINNDASLLFNNGDGSFAPEQRIGIGSQIPGAGNYPWGIATGDLDGDGDTDIVVADAISHMSVLLNGGDGTIASVRRLEALSDSPFNVTLGDFDADGDLDMACTDLSRPLGVFLNNGDATFASVLRYNETGEPLAVVAGDLDGDGDEDAVVADSLTDHFAVLLNQCTTAICTGDCDANGSVDFGDLVAMLGEFGASDTTFACDADQSGTVDFGDLVAALGLFGECP